MYVHKVRFGLIYAHGARETQVSTGDKCKCFFEVDGYDFPRWLSGRFCCAARTAVYHAIILKLFMIFVGRGFLRLRRKQQQRQKRQRAQ